MSAHKLNLRLPTALALFAIVLSTRAVAAADPPEPLNFSFGPGPAPAGYALVTPDATYSDERGYGFEPGGARVKSVVEYGAPDPRPQAVTSDRPFYFSVKLPKEGNYAVTVTFGRPAGPSDNTVKAELRRLVLEGVKTESGKFETRTFTVNTRTPAVAGSDRKVKLKDREKTAEAWDWDDKLTLEFNGPRPAVAAVEIAPAPEATTVFLLGDSTVCDQPAEPWNSWGQMLPRFFKPTVAVANHAESGESLRSSLAANRLDKVLSLMKPGDYLFIQYGHNDMKERGPAIGAFTSYKADLARFVAAARERGGLPVLVTSMHRKSFGSDGKITNTLGDYPDAVRKLAREQNVPLIDLNAISKTLYEAIGQDNIDKAFQDGTHHNNYGSYELAKCVVTAVRELRLPLADQIIDNFTFDPAHPDPIDTFALPPSPRATDLKPLGN